jgi:hypothetical protein
MNLLAVLGTGAALWSIFKPKDPVDKITDHAMLLTGQMISQGVPVAEAVKAGAATAVDQHFAQTGQLPPAPLPVQPRDAIVSLDPSQVINIMSWGK